MYKYTILLLSLIAALVWLAVFSFDEKLYVVACDVGQGDAVLIQHRSDQILVDGGPGSKVLECLGRYMPFWDRTIELIILTHWDTDHSGGLPDVFKAYRVKSFLTNTLNNPEFGNETTKVLESEVGRGRTHVLDPYNLPAIRLGLIYLDILHPTREFKNSKSNNYSIVTLLRYADFEALLPGDVEDAVSDLISKNSKVHDVDYIKIPHHGSKNGISEDLLKASKPEVGVISVGERNSFGHPHGEVLELLNTYAVKFFRTDEKGDVVVVTDGKFVQVR